VWQEKGADCETIRSPTAGRDRYDGASGASSSSGSSFLLDSLVIRPPAASKISSSTSFFALPAFAQGNYVYVHNQDVASSISAFSVSPAGTTGIFFQNIGRTRRQGLEAIVRSKLSSVLEVTASYSFARATFEEDVFLNTPRATSDCTSFACNERVRKGSDFPLVPRHRARAGLEVHPVSWLVASVSGSYVGAQRLRGDEENVAPLLPSYFSFDGGVKATAGRLWGSVNVFNLVGSTYSTFGTYATNAKAPGNPVEPFLTPGRPFQLVAALGYGL